MKKTNVLSNSSSRSDHANREIEAIQKLADDFHLHDKSAKTSLYEALDRLFSMVESFDGDESFMKEFVLSRGEKWGKIANDNPFQPFVKIGFSGKGNNDASRSQYAKVLHYAKFERDKSVSLKDWLFANGGIEGLYQRANVYFPQQRGHIDEASLFKAVQALRTQRHSDSFKLTHLPTVSDGLVMAILHVDTAGNAHVVEYAEQDQDKLAKIVEKLAKPSAKQSQAIVKPLYRLFRALTIMDKAVERGVADDRLILLRSTMDAAGKRSAYVKAVSRIYTGTLGEIHINEDFTWLPDDVVYALDQHKVEQFCTGFMGLGEWSVMVDGNNALHFTHSTNIVQPIVAQSFSQKPSNRYYQARTDIVKSKPVRLKQGDIRAFADWQGDQHANWSAKQRKQKQPMPFPRALKPELHLKELSLSPVGMLGVKLPIMEIAVDPNFSDDRLVDGKAMQRLCEALSNLDTDVLGYIVDTEEANAALLIYADIGGDVVNILMPFVKNKSCDSTQTNEFLPT